MGNNKGEGDIMSKHTKTPWRLGGFASIWSGVQEQSAISSDLVCVLPELDENREGNAEFIIRAVNSHDALVEALEEARNCLATWMEIAEPNDVRGYDEDAIKQIDKALKLAKGK